MSTVTPATLVFFGLAALVVGCAAGVAFSRNILRSAFLLLGALAGTAGLYLTMGADFVGVTQILIYVGGILVLLLFAVLLTSGIGRVRVSNRSMGLAAGVPVGIALAAAIIYVAVTTPWRQTEAVATPMTARLGEAFLDEYLVVFELVSVVLLMALIGAMVLARRAVKTNPVPAGAPREDHPLA
jgi:NADH-quinone oxidoreductase subunit J